MQVFSAAGFLGRSEQNRAKGEEKMGKDDTAAGQVKHPEKMSLPPYVPPKIITYTAEQIAEHIGPALTCTGPCPVQP